MNGMHKYLAGVLTVIAVGVLTIAYSLAFPPAPGAGLALTAAPGLTEVAAPAAPIRAEGVRAAVPLAFAAPAGPSERWVAVPVSEDLVPAASRRPRAVPTLQTVDVDVEPDEIVTRAPRRVVTRTVERRGRDWKKTAMIVGGTTAAGAGLGGLFGGKKGALIGAAIGGGASTIYETRR